MTSSAEQDEKIRPMVAPAFVSLPSFILPIAVTDFYHPFGVGRISVILDCLPILVTGLMFICLTYFSKANWSKNRWLLYQFALFGTALGLFYFGNSYFDQNPLQKVALPIESKWSGGKFGHQRFVKVMIPNGKGAETSGVVFEVQNSEFYSIVLHQTTMNLSIGKGLFGIPWVASNSLDLK